MKMESRFVTRIAVLPVCAGHNRRDNAAHLPVAIDMCDSHYDGQYTKLSAHMHDAPLIDCAGHAVPPFMLDRICLCNSHSHSERIAFLTTPLEIPCRNASGLQRKTPMRVRPR